MRINATVCVAVVFFAIGLIQSCASVPNATLDPQVNPNIAYRQDMAITSAGVSGTGMLTVPVAAKYHFDLQMPSQPEFMTIKTCGRSQLVNVSSNKYGFDYVPNAVELQDPPCELNIQAYSQKFNYTAATVDFTSPSTKMQARLYCDGGSQLVFGSSVCQSQAGTMQRIDFLDFMNAATPPLNCAPPLPVKGVEGLAFTIVLSPGECVYNFGQVHGTGQIHRLTTYGFQEFPLAR